MLEEDLKVNGQPVVGYLGQDGVLYCSNGCAAGAGQRSPSALDIDELDALLEGDGAKEGILCPVCGESFPVTWPEPTPD
jgi:hypothetical protein